MIDIYVTGSNNMWFGMAYIGEKIVTTAFNSSKDRKQLKAFSEVFRLMRAIGLLRKGQSSLKERFLF